MRSELSEAMFQVSTTEAGASGCPSLSIVWNMFVSSSRVSCLHVQYGKKFELRVRDAERPGGRARV